jgi:membrane associated rhomboid family serine protease
MAGSAISMSNCGVSEYFQENSFQEDPMHSIPPVTRVLLIANVLIYLLQQVIGSYLDAHFALWPLGDSRLMRLDDGSPVNVGFELWQLVTYSFLHGGSLVRGNIGHVAFNMFALWMFGGPVETALRANRYILYYFVCVVGAAVAQLAVIHFFQPDDFYPTVGASGGVFGLLVAFAVIYPGARIALLFIPIPIPATIAVIGYLVIEFVLGVTGVQAGVAHFAHIGGALAGFVLLRMWRAQALRGPDR